MTQRKTASRAISWRGPESLYKKKTLLWYTHVTVAFGLMATLLVLFESWVGLAIASALFILFLLRANDRPRHINYTIDTTGITVGDRTLAYSEIASCSLDTDHHRPVIVLDLAQTWSMPVTLVIKLELVDNVLETLTQYVPYSDNFSFTRWLMHALHY